MSRRPGASTPTPVRLLLGATLVVATIAFLAVLATFGGPSAYALTYGGVIVGAAVVAVLSCRRHRRPLTSPAALVAAALCATALGELLWYADRAYQGADPGVGVADVAFLASYPLLLAALVRAIRTAQGGRLRADVAIDVLTIVTVSLLVVWELAVEGIATNETVPLGARLVSSAYPLLDAVLLGLAVRVACQRHARAVVGIPLALGLAAWLAADLGYVALGLDHALSPLLYLGWIGGAVAMVRAVVAPRTAPRPEPVETCPALSTAADDAAWARLAIAVVPLVAPSALLVGHRLTGQPAPIWSVTGTTVVLVALAFARTLLLLREQEQGAQALAAARDAAQQASRAKSAFLATMSHEIRTPMNGVTGLTELLLATDLDDRQREYARGVESAGRALLVLIDDVLDFSKIEAGRVDLEHVPFSLAEVVDDVAQAASLDHRARGLDLLAYVSPDVPAVLRGDPGRVRQVLLNLVSNAVKFTHQGEVVVSVHLAGGPTSHPVVRLEVRDTGVGVDQAARERLFEPFSQADSSTTRRYGGTGLGLAICRGLAEQMGGEVGVDSVLGVGSTFWFTVPLERVREEAAPATPAAHDDRPEPRCSAAVLVVEDSEVNQLVAEGMLRKLGCTVEIAENGLLALEALQARHYDLVLMDCQMPEMDGYDATAELRRREVDGARTPVVAMTASVTAEERERCRLVGMDDFVSKPVSLAALSSALDRWVGARGDAPEA